MTEQAQPPTETEAEPRPLPDPLPDPASEPEAHPGPGPDPAPESEPAPDPAPPSAPTGAGRARRLLLGAVGGLTGILVTAAVTAGVTPYLNSWTRGGNLPGSGGLHAETELLWDTREEIARDVLAARPITPDEVARLDGSIVGQQADLMDQGGVYSGLFRLRLTLINFSQVPATVDSVRARLLPTGPVPTGKHFSCGGPQGVSPLAHVRIDLGSADLSALEYEDDKAIGTYPTDQVQLAKQDDPALFDLNVLAGPVIHRFVLDIAYTQGTEHRTISVDDHGKPFVLAPRGERADTYLCDPVTNTWRPMP